jgi:hypothetical protein
VLYSGYGHRDTDCELEMAAVAFVVEYEESWAGGFGIGPAALQRSRCGWTGGKIVTLMTSRLSTSVKKIWLQVVQ